MAVRRSARTTMNQLFTVFVCLTANAALLVVATDLKSCVRVGCEHCLSNPRVARICPLKCSSCDIASRKNGTVEPRVQAVPIVAVLKQQPGKAIPVPAYKRSRLVSLKMIMPKSATVHMPNSTHLFTENSTTPGNVSLSNTTETSVPSVVPEPQPAAAANGSAFHELSGNVAVNGSAATKKLKLTPSNATVAASTDTKKPKLKLTSVAPRAQAFLIPTNANTRANKLSAEANTESNKAINATTAANISDSPVNSTIVYVKQESYTGHGTPKSIIVAAAVTNNEPIRHESRPHAELNKFLDELSLPPVSEHGKDNRTTVAQLVPLRRRIRPTTPPTDEEYYVDELSPPDEVAPVLYSPPNTAAVAAPAPQPQDPISVLFAPLRGTLLDPTSLLGIFSPPPLAAPAVATLSPTLAPSDPSAFYVDEPSDLVYIDSQVPKGQKKSRRIDGVGTDVNDKDGGSSTANKATFGSGKEQLRPPVQQCPRLPGLEPCISKQEADARFLQCCSPLGVGCLPLCTYDASFTAIQVAVITGQCAISKIATVLQCASGNEDATGCCQAKGVFEVGLEHCRPYCNPSAGLPSGQISENYRCLSKLADIQYCFHASQKPRQRS